MAQLSLSRDTRAILPAAAPIVDIEVQTAPLLPAIHKPKKRETVQHACNSCRKTKCKVSTFILPFDSLRVFLTVNEFYHDSNQHSVMAIVQRAPNATDLILVASMTPKKE